MQQALHYVPVGPRDRIVELLGLRALLTARLQGNYPWISVIHLL